MLQTRCLGLRRLCACFSFTSSCGLSTIMTVNTVTSDPRVTAQCSQQRQPFSTAPATEASGNSYYRPRMRDDATEVQGSTGSDFTSPRKARSNSHHRNKGEDESRVYVLTLLTDKEHHQSMTALRKHYFPPKLNKLDSHITLFHALPGQNLEQDIVPAIKSMVSETRPYRIEAREPSRLSQGFSINVADDIDNAKGGNKHNKGRNMTRIIHAELRKKWSDFLSEQDSRPPKIHYTIMNKVSDQVKCEKDLDEVKGWIREGSIPRSLLQTGGPGELDLSQDQAPLHLVGTVLGLSLWKYERGGRWVEPQHFKFPTE